MPQKSKSRSNNRMGIDLADVADLFTVRNMLLVGAGAMIMAAATRMGSPLAGRAIGSMRALAGTDPFDALAQDHRKVLALMEAVEATSESATHRRTAMLLQIKRMLTAHALAEEDIIYPMLHDDAARKEQALKLYREHADIKVKLFELEHKAKDDPSWIADMRALHRIVENHAREEEEVEFPKLRAALDETQRASLLSEVHREKAMLI
jgi:hemerythrin superfamily protein